MTDAVRTSDIWTCDRCGRTTEVVTEGEDVGPPAGWMPSRVAGLSKIENGHEAPSDAAVRALCAVYDDEADVLLLDRAIGRVPFMVRSAIEQRALESVVEEVARWSRAVDQHEQLRDVDWEALSEGAKDDYL